MNNLFMYLFWDIIYQYKVPGAFLSELQYVPLDFYSENFYKNRKCLIDFRFREISSFWTEEELRQFLTRMVDEHCSEQSLVQNLELTIDDYFDAILCIGRDVLSKILERLVKNYRLFHSGMPDLFMWNPETRTVT